MTSTWFRGAHRLSFEQPLQMMPVGYYMEWERAGAARWTYDGEEIDEFTAREILAKWRLAEEGPSA